MCAVLHTWRETPARIQTLCACISAALLFLGGGGKRDTAVSRERREASKSLSFSLPFISLALLREERIRADAHSRRSLGRFVPPRCEEHQMSYHLGRNLLRMRTHEFTCGRASCKCLSYPRLLPSPSLSRPQKKKLRARRRSLKLLVLQDSPGASSNTLKGSRLERHVNILRSTRRT